MSTSNRQHTAESGSRTLTIPQTREVSDVSSPNEPEAGPSRSPTAGVLKLRGGPARRQKVVWSEETVDNEGMGKKKSKICCIYHRPKAYDESSSESESDSNHHHHVKGKPHKKRPDAQESSESDGGGGDGRARPPRARDTKANKYDQTKAK